MVDRPVHHGHGEGRFRGVPGPGVSSGLRLRLFWGGSERLMGQSVWIGGPDGEAERREFSPSERRFRRPERRSHNGVNRRKYCITVRRVRRSERSGTPRLSFGASSCRLRPQADPHPDPDGPAPPSNPLPAEPAAHRPAPRLMVRGLQAAGPSAPPAKPSKPGASGSERPREKWRMQHSVTIRAR